MSGHVSSQSGTQLPGVSPQNGNVVPNIVAAGGGAPHAGFGMDADLLRARTFMQEKIFVLLAQRHHQQMNDSQMQKLKDIVKRLEEGLLKTAPSKEEYLNMSTLEFRLHSLIKRPSLNNRNPVNPNSMPTMIPTPGLSHNGSSTMMATSSVDAQMSNMVGSSSMQPTNANTGNLMSSGVMQSSSFNRTDGLLSNGYQQAQANYPIDSGGINLSQMNVQADMLGHVSSQSGTQLPGVSPQNGNVVPNIVAAGGGAPHAGFGMDADLLRARNYMQEKIFVFLAQRHHQQMNDSQIQKLKDIVKRLEEGLFKTAPSKEEYLNMSTLEFRLHNLIKRPSLNNRNPVNPNSMPTMIPTPGLSHNGSSTMMATSSVDAQMSNVVGNSSMQPTNANTGNLISSGVMQSSSFNRTDGLLSNGYQQAQANYPIGSGGNNLSQMGVPRMSSQMIPTPGFNNNNSGNHSYGSVEATDNGGRMSIVDSPMVSRDPHQKLHVRDQDSRVLHALGSQTGGAIRSGIQQKSYGFSNGALNGGLVMIGIDLPMSNGPSTSEGFVNASPYINFPKPLQHQLININANLFRVVRMGALLTFLAVAIYTLLELLLDHWQIL